MKLCVGACCGFSGTLFVDLDFSVISSIVFLPETGSVPLCDYFLDCFNLRGVIC